MSEFLADHFVGGFAAVNEMKESTGHIDNGNVVLVMAKQGTSDAGTILRRIALDRGHIQPRAKHLEQGRTGNPGSVLEVIIADLGPTLSLNDTGHAHDGQKLA
jgi:hypothetical protein